MSKCAYSVFKIKDLSLRGRVFSLSKMKTLLFQFVLLDLVIVSSSYGKQKHDCFQATSNDAEDFYQNDEPRRTQDFFKSKPMKITDIIRLLKIYKLSKDKSVFNRIIGKNNNDVNPYGRITWIWG